VQELIQFALLVVRQRTLALFGKEIQSFALEFLGGRYLTSCRRLGVEANKSANS